MSGVHDKREVISGAELARRLGVSRMAVTYARQQGRLDSAVVDPNAKRPKYRWPDVKQAWADNADARFHPKVTTDDRPPPPPTPKPKQEPAAPVADRPPPDEPGLPARAKSQQIEAIYKARLVKLEYEEKTGRVISADRVRAERFRAGRALRDAILNIPTRVAHSLAAELGLEVDPLQVHSVMDKELRELLSEVSNANRIDAGQ